MKVDLDPRHVPAPTIRGTALGIAAALAVTGVVYAIGNLGAPIRVVTGWNPSGADLTLAEVALTATTAVALGGVVLWLMERRWPRSFATWEWLAGGVAVLSAVPLLRLDIDAGSKVSLVCMHLATGACAIGAHRMVRGDRA